MAVVLPKDASNHLLAVQVQKIVTFMSAGLKVAAITSCLN